MNFEKFNKLVASRMHYGEIDEPSVVSEYKNIGCGDAYRLYLKIEDGIIAEANYTTTGCSFSLASLSILCEAIRGKSLDEAYAITTDELEAYIDGYPERRKVYAETALQALTKAIDDYKNDTGIPLDQVVMRNGVLKLLAEQGHLRNQNLNSAMLDGLDLSRVDFSGSNLHHAFLRNAKLNNSILDDCNLKGAYLDDTDMTNASFKNADLRFAKMMRANFTDTDFSGALYDIGTRVAPKDISIFDQMIKKGKELYVKAQG